MNDTHAERATHGETCCCVSLAKTAKFGSATVLPRQLQRLKIGRCHLYRGPCRSFFSPHFAHREVEFDSICNLESLHYLFKKGFNRICPSQLV